MPDSTRMQAGRQSDPRARFSDRFPTPEDGFRTNRHPTYLVYLSFLFLSFHFLSYTSIDNNITILPDGRRSRELAGCARRPLPSNPRPASPPRPALLSQ